MYFASYKAYYTLQPQNPLPYMLMYISSETVHHNIPLDVLSDTQLSPQYTWSYFVETTASEQKVKWWTSVTELQGPSYWHLDRVRWMRNWRALGSKRQVECAYGSLYTGCYIYPVTRTIDWSVTYCVGIQQAWLFSWWRSEVDFMKTRMSLIVSQPYQHKLS
jgi:hypothetical protein